MLLRITNTTPMLVARRGPQRLHRVHRAAVADEADHRPVGQRELDADRGRQAPADAAAAQAEIALRIVAADELADARRRGQRLLDHDGVLRQHLADARASSASGCTGVCVRKRARLGFQRLALGGDRVARGLQPLARGAAARRSTCARARRR